MCDPHKTVEFGYIDPRNPSIVEVEEVDIETNTTIKIRVVDRKDFFKKEKPLVDPKSIKAIR